MSTDEIDNFFISNAIPEPPVEKAPPPPPPPPPAPQQAAPKNGNHSPNATIPNLTGFDRGLPANTDAERTVLGAILLDNDELKKVSLTIDPDDFSLDANQKICLRMKELFESGRPIDIVTLSNELSKHREIDAIGGVAYIASLTDGLPRRPVIDEYIRIVKDKSILRRLMGMCSSSIGRAADQMETAPQVLALLEAQLIELKDKCRVITRQRNDQPFFVGFRTFVNSYPDEVQWTVEGIIQADGNGLILGDPGTSKSLNIFDLSLHLVAGASWFHHRIPHRKRVGLVSREDAPGLSQSRLKRLREGAPEALSMFLEGLDLEEWIFVHTRAQRETWTLQNETDIQEIIDSIKERGIQICFFDVFRVLWHGNENDSRETALVLESVKRIGREAGCQIGLVHHVSKSDRGTIFDRARGSGILGWREWAMGITIENPDADPRDQVRKMEFQTKAGCASNPIYYRIDGYEQQLRLDEVDAPSPQYQFNRSSKKKEKETTQPLPYADN